MALKGTLADLSIVDLLQFPHIGRKTGELRVAAGGNEAKAYYRNGSLVHAEVEDAEGMDALVRIVAWTEGSFEFRPEVETESRTIEIDLHRAVMQALKLHDEIKVEQERRMATDNKTDSASEIGRHLDHFIASSDFALHASVISDQGDVLAEAHGSDGPPEGIDGLRTTLHRFVQSYPRPDLKRIFVDDHELIVVMAVLKNGVSLIVLSRKDAPLGAVAMNVNKLAARLE